MSDVELELQYKPVPEKLIRDLKTHRVVNIYLKRKDLFVKKFGVNIQKELEELEECYTKGTVARPFLIKRISKVVEYVARNRNMFNNPAGK